MNFISVHRDAEISGDLADALLAAFGDSSQNSRQSGKPRANLPAHLGFIPPRSNTSAGQFENCADRLASNFSTLDTGNLRLLAACAFFTGDDQLAARAASALAAAQPHSLEALYWSIQANERLALKALARFQQLEPDSARSHVLLGDIFHQLERHDDAQAEYQKALAITPGDPAALLGLASAYLSNNNNDGAIDTAKAALAHSPDDPELNLIMGEAMLAKNDYASAEPSLRKALHAKPQMIPHAHALLGKIYAETGRTEQAIDELKLGASSDEDGAIQYLLARMYRKLGNTEAANAALERMKIIKAAAPRPRNQAGGRSRAFISGVVRRCCNALAHPGHQPPSSIVHRAIHRASGAIHAFIPPSSCLSCVIVFALFESAGGYACSLTGKGFRFNRGPGRRSARESDGSPR